MIYVELLHFGYSAAYCIRIHYNELKSPTIAHRINVLKWQWAGLSAVEPTTVAVNEFWSGDRVSVNVV
jgi:hypothetical protein